MKKIYFFLMAMLVTFAAKAWTVSFTNPDNWENVYVYAWDGNKSGDNWVTSAWPGSVMNHEGDVWTFTGEGTPTQIIFNAGGDQAKTGDLKFVDGATYTTTGAIMSYTIKYDNSKSNWPQVYAYLWNGDKELASWPGIAMQLEGDMYVLTFENFEAATVIFNNGSDQAKTLDLPFVAGATYDLEGQVGVEIPTHAVYFDNKKSNWDKVYAHVWGNGHNTTWPGVECQYDPQTELHYYAVQAPLAPANLIFNNGGNGQQTDNLTFSHGKIYDKDGDTGKVSGIKNVSVEEAPVEYYNLQGVRVAEPANGLYIRRQGNKVTKVMFR